MNKTLLPSAPGFKTKASPSTAARRCERGFATFGVLVAFILLMGIAAMLSFAVTQTARAERRDDSKQFEYWRANGNAETLEAQLTHDLPETYARDLRAARNLAGLRPLPAFDPPSVSSDSRPVYRNGAQAYPANQATSLLGRLNDYVNGKLESITSAASRKGLDPNNPDASAVAEFRNTTSVADIKEDLRRESSGANNVGRSEAYVLKYQIHANYALGGRVQPSGTIQLGNTGAGCTSSVNVTANPTTIRRGSAATLRVTYAATDRIQLKAGGAVVRTNNVTFSDAAQSLDIPVSPNTTTTYDVTALTGNCQAAAAPVTINVEWNDAQYVSQSVPADVEAGTVTPVSVTMRNSGTTVWKPGTYFLGSNIASWGVTRVAVPRNVAPGDVVTFNFNITAPASPPNPCPSSANFQWQMIEQGVEWFGQMSPLTPIGIRCPPPRYEGNFESADCTTLRGWVYNASFPDSQVSVKVYFDGSFYGQVTADQYRADLQAASKGNGQHGFSLPTPVSLQDGFPHTIHITTADDIYTLANSPRSITCGARYEGTFERADCTEFSGWGWDRNQPGSSTQISLFADGNPLLNLSADIFRADLAAGGIGDGRHGFQTTTPNGLRDGRNHSISAFFAGSGRQLSGSPRTINCPPPADPCPTVGLTANGSKSIIVDESESFNLAWTSTGAATINIDNGIGSVAVPSSSRSFSFPSQGTYTITATATNPDGSCTKTDSVTIQVRRVADPCPTVDATADGQKSLVVNENQAFNLAWTSSNATEIIFDNGIGSVAVPGGSRSMSFATAGTYLINATAFNAGRVCSDGDTVSVDVRKILPGLSVSLNVNGAKSATINTNEAATLSYSSTGAAELFIDNGIGAVPVPSSTRTIQFAVPGTYRVTLTGYSDGRSDVREDSVTITVSPRPVPTVTLTINGAKSATVREGDPFNLAWTSTNASELVIDNGIGPVDVPSSTRTERFPAAGQYRITITAFNSDHSATAQDFVDLTVERIPPPECPTVTLAITDGTMAGRIKLIYTSTNASALSIDQGVGSVTPPSGNVEINAPGAQTTYTIAATPNDGRCANAYATATYTPPPRTGSPGWFLGNNVSIGGGTGTMGLFVNLRENKSGDVDVAVFLWGFALGSNLSGNYNIEVLKDNNTIFTTSDGVQQVPASSCRQYRIPAGSIPPGSSLVHIRVVSKLFPEFSPSFDQITVDSRMPNDTLFPGDSPTMTLCPQGVVCHNQSVERINDWATYPPSPLGCNLPPE